MSKTTPTIRDTTPSKVPMSNAERQRKHREKRKAELMALRAGAAASLSRRLALPLPHCFMQSTGAHRSSAEESARRPARQLCLWRRFFPLDLLSFTF